MSGRHRIPSNTTKRLGAAALIGGLGALAPAGIAEAGTLDNIMACESGGKNIVNHLYNTNPNYYSASGYFQIVNSTWRANGGLEFAPTAIQATYAEQKIVAERILARSGTQPWVSSKSCWSKKAAGATVKVEVPAAKTAPKAPKVKKVVVPEKKVVKTQPLPAVTGLVKQETKVEQLQVLPVVVPSNAKPTAGGSGDYTVKPGDTLSQLAVTHNVPGGWKTIAEKNRDVVEHADWIFPGEKLDF